jgi:hypothetical protein
VPHFGLGLLEPDAEDRLDEESVGYFQHVEEEALVQAGKRPDSYSSVKEGQQALLLHAKINALGVQL